MRGGSSPARSDRVRYSGSRTVLGLGNGSQSVCTRGPSSADFNGYFEGKSRTRETETVGWFKKPRRQQEALCSRRVRATHSAAALGLLAQGRKHGTIEDAAIDWLLRQATCSLVQPQKHEIRCMRVAAVEKREVRACCPARSARELTSAKVSCMDELVASYKNQ